MHRFVGAIGAIAVAALLAGCGSSAKPSVDTTKVLTKAEYIQASNDICDDYAQQINAVVGTAGDDLSFEDAKATLETQLIPLFQAEHKALVALKPPPADAAAMKGALDSMNHGIEEIAREVALAKSKNALNAIKPQGIASWKAEVGLYGILKCGSPPSTTSTT